MDKHRRHRHPSLNPITRTPPVRIAETDWDAHAQHYIATMVGRGLSLTHIRQLSLWTLYHSNGARLDAVQDEFRLKVHTSVVDQIQKKLIASSTARASAAELQKRAAGAAKKG